MRGTKIVLPPTFDQVRDRVFRLRCASKEGRQLDENDTLFLSAVHKRWPEQYAEISLEVFEATKPFGAR